MLSEFLCHLVSLPLCMGPCVALVSMSLGLIFVMYRSLCCLSFYVTWFHSRSVWVAMLSEFLSLGLTFVLYGSFNCLSFYVAWSHFRDVWLLLLSEFLFHLVSLPLNMGLVLFEFLCHLVSLPFCMYLYIVRVPISLCLTFTMKGSLCSPSFYVTWSHFRSIWVLVLPEFLCHLVSNPFCMYLYFVWVSMSLGLTFFLHESLCYLSFYVTWSHFRYAWVLVLPKFLCRLVSLSWCIGSCVVWGFYINSSRIHYIWVLCCLCFYVTWSHFRSVRVSMLSEFLYHLVSFPLYMGPVLSEFLCHLVSLPFCMGLYVVRVSMSLGLTFVLYLSVLSEFLCHLVSLPFCMYLYLVRVSMSLGLTFVL